jgi:hypothetical protein
VPIAPDQSTTILVVKSHMPISFAGGRGKAARIAIRLESANGHISLGLLRPRMAAPTTVTQATKALKGKIRKATKSTPICYNVQRPLSTTGGVTSRAAFDPLRTFTPSVSWHREGVAA